MLHRDDNPLFSLVLRLNVWCSLVSVIWKHGKLSLVEWEHVDSPCCLTWLLATPNPNPKANCSQLSETQETALMQGSPVAVGFCHLTLPFGVGLSTNRLRLCIDLCYAKKKPITLKFIISTQQNCQTRVNEYHPGRLQDRPLFFHKLLTVSQSVGVSQFLVLTIFSHSIRVNHCSPHFSSGCVSAVLQQQFPLFTTRKSNLLYVLCFFYTGNYHISWMKGVIWSLAPVNTRTTPSTVFYFQLY